MQLLLFQGFWQLWCWYFTQFQVDIVTSWTVQLAIKKWCKFRLLGNFINIMKVELRVWRRIFCGRKKFNVWSSNASKIHVHSHQTSLFYEETENYFKSVSDCKCLLWAVESSRLDCTLLETEDNCYLSKNTSDILWSEHLSYLHRRFIPVFSKNRVLVLCTKLEKVQYHFMMNKNTWDLVPVSLVTLKSPRTTMSVPLDAHTDKCDILGRIKYIAFYTTSLFIVQLKDYFKTHRSTGSDAF